MKCKLCRSTQSKLLQRQFGSDIKNVRKQVVRETNWMDDLVWFSAAEPGPAVRLPEHETFSPVSAVSQRDRKRNLRFFVHFRPFLYRFWFNYSEKSGDIYGIITLSLIFLPPVFFLLISLPVILSSLLQSQVYVPCRQAGRLFSNQVRIAGVDWQAAVSIDSPLHPSISRPAEALTRDGTGGRGERGAHGFKRPLLERFMAPGWVRHQTQKINLLESIWLISLQRERERLQIITSSD